MENSDMLSSQSQIENIHYHKNLVEWDERLHFDFRNYKPNINIQIKTEKYTLSTAITMQELKELFMMRHRIFFIETGIATDLSLDMDEFDSSCDHLVIRSNQTGEICATYRIITRQTSPQFYSEGEFDLGELLKEPGVTLELGRACIHPAHRNGSLQDLLWKGIGAYIRRIHADMLFGCSSVTTSPQIVSRILKMLKENNFYSDKFNIRPKEDYKLNFLELLDNDEDNTKKVMDYLPALLKSYLHAGAKVYGAPALDKEFQCTDFFTVLFLKDTNPAYRKRYLNKAEIYE
jgi:putative hemolysin